MLSKNIWQKRYDICSYIINLVVQEPARAQVQFTRNISIYIQGVYERVRVHWRSRERGECVPGAKAPGSWSLRYFDMQCLLNLRIIKVCICPLTEAGLIIRIFLGNLSDKLKLLLSTIYIIIFYNLSLAINVHSRLLLLFKSLKKHKLFYRKNNSRDSIYLSISKISHERWLCGRG